MTRYSDVSPVSYTMTKPEMLLPLLIGSISDSKSVVRAERRFPARPASVARARRFVVASVGSDDPDLDSRLAALVSELATNSIRHARSPFDVEVRRDDHTVKVSVKDGSPEMPKRRAHDPVDPTGRGLVVVEALADRWGFNPEGAGKAVWFEIDT